MPFFQSENKTFISNSSTGPFFQAKQEEKVLQDDEQDCKGWESDPQSFCNVVAKHFVITEFNSGAQIDKIEVSDDGGCHVFFDDGLVVTVQKMGGQKVFVQVSPSSTKKSPGRVRCYTYTCSTAGKLNLVLTSCSGK